jgi:hypothetical protein
VAPLWNPDADDSDAKQSCRLATTAALPSNTASGSGPGKTLTAVANGALSVDSVATVQGDRVLVKDESTGADNGIYDVTDPGSAGSPYVLTRSEDADLDEEVTSGMFTWIEEGTTNAETFWVLTTVNPITVDTTALVFEKFYPSGGGGSFSGKSGRVLASSFSGTPQTASVSFNTNFASANYAITLGVVSSSTRRYVPVAQSKAVGGFTINLGSNNKTDLVSVDWVAIPDTNP